MKKLIFLTILSVSTIFLESCMKKSGAAEVFADTINTEKTRREEPVRQLNREEILKNRNREIVQKIKDGRFSELAEDIHLEKGIRFSMYAYVSAEDKVFSAEDYRKYVETPVRFTWGKTDGEGRDLVLNISEYLKTWVFKRDFSNAIVTVNEFQGHGNSLNNLQEQYPEADFTENYIAGSEKYSGMDWNSLRLVFEEFNGKFYLVAVINDQWTI